MHPAAGCQAESEKTHEGAAGQHRRIRGGGRGQTGRLQGWIGSVAKRIGHIGAGRSGSPTESHFIRGDSIAIRRVVQLRYPFAGDHVGVGAFLPRGIVGGNREIDDLRHPAGP